MVITGYFNGFQWDYTFHKCGALLNAHWTLSPCSAPGLRGCSQAASDPTSGHRNGTFGSLWESNIAGKPLMNRGSIQVHSWENQKTIPAYPSTPCSIDGVYATICTFFYYLVNANSPRNLTLSHVEATKHVVYDKITIYSTEALFSRVLS